LMVRKSRVTPRCGGGVSLARWGLKDEKAALRAATAGRGCIKLLEFSLSSIGWRRGLGRGGAFLLVSPLLGPLPTRSSRGEDGELDAALRAATAVRVSWATSWARETARRGFFSAAIRAFWFGLPMAAATAGSVSSIGLSAR